MIVCSIETRLKHVLKHVRNEKKRFETLFIATMPVQYDLKIPNLANDMQLSNLSSSNVNPAEDHT